MTTDEQLKLLSQKKLVYDCRERYRWLQWRFGTYFMEDKKITDLQLLKQYSATLETNQLLDDATIQKITDFYEMLLDSGRG
jgi:hypothetical protein